MGRVRGWCGSERRLSRRGAALRYAVRGRLRDGHARDCTNRDRAEPAGEEAGGLAPAFARGRRTRADLPGAEGGTPTAAEVARRLGLTRQAVEQRRRAGRLLALPTDRRGYAYRAW